ncbi:MAG: phosphoribosyltransferase [Burkholderiaceae bacterium]
MAMRVSTPHPISQRFADRADAGRQLAELLASQLPQPPQANTVVLALPRGGIPIGLAIAQRFDLALEPLLVRKLGVPNFPEFAMGAIATGGICLVDDAVVNELHLSDQAVQQVIQSEQLVLAERERRYGASVSLSILRGREVIVCDDGMATGGICLVDDVVVKELNLSDQAVQQVIESEQRILAERERRYGASVSLSNLRGREVIVCDDGMATGRTMQAAIAALRAVRVASILVAVPVMSQDALARIAPLVEQVESLLCPASVDAVGQWYRNFPQLGDDEVIRLLSQVQRLSASVSATGKVSTSSS